MTTTIKLQFPTAEMLWRFRVEALIDFINSDPYSNILTCRCSHEQLKLALTKYHASVFVEEREQSSSNQ